MLVHPVCVQPHAAVIDAAREHLARVAASAAFVHSRRHRRLLSYLLEQALNSPAASSKETVIAVEVFGRDTANYDPRLDPIVRVEAGRLRRRLAGYYAGEGSDDVLRFELPRGAYALRLHWHSAAAAMAPDVDAPRAVAGRLVPFEALRIAANHG
ncbi:MAG: hypothetical protein QM741_09485 [Rudaea sp.]|uniref:hypothetical protein n=1 Tax=Rudaea sp. TaxID=2136325 RepID=UPI0039E6474F